MGLDLIWWNGHLFGLFFHFNPRQLIGKPLASVKKAWSLVISGGMHASSDEIEGVWPSSKDMMVLRLLWFGSYGQYNPY